MCVILADSDEINLQLERTVSFICQSKSNSVDLENSKGDEVNKRVAFTVVSELCQLNLVQPEHILAILHPSATCEEKL